MISELDSDCEEKIKIKNKKRCVHRHVMHYQMPTATTLGRGVYPPRNPTSPWPRSKARRQASRTQLAVHLLIVLLPFCKLLVQQNLQGQRIKASNYGMHALLDHQMHDITACLHHLVLPSLHTCHTRDMMR